MPSLGPPLVRVKPRGEVAVFLSIALGGWSYATGVARRHESTHDAGYGVFGGDSRPKVEVRLGRQMLPEHCVEEPPVKAALKSGGHKDESKQTEMELRQEGAVKEGVS